MQLPYKKIPKDTKENAIKKFSAAWVA